MSTPPYTPEVHVEFAFGYGPLADTTDGSFVEPAAVYPTQVIVDGVQIGRGRPSEFDTFQPGTCQISIVDRNRVFDPLNTAGPYYGLLKPRVPVRVRGKIGATYYPRFYGYVDGWPMQIARQETLVNIVATDGFKILQGIRLGQTFYDTEVLSDSPHGYWRLAEATGQKAVDSSVNKYDGTYSVVTTSRGLPPIAPYGSGSTEFRAIVGEMVEVPNARIDATPISIELWFQSDAGTQSVFDYGLFYQPKYVDDGSHQGFSFQTQSADSVTPNGGIGLLWKDSPTFDFTEWDINLFDSQPHHLVLVLTSSDITLYHNGQPVPIAASVNLGLSYTAASPVYIGAFVGYASVPGRIGDVSTYTTALSASTVAAHYAAGANIGDGEITGARVTRILDAINWSATARSVDVGEQILGPANLDGRTVLEYLQAIAASEQGRLFMSRDGKVTFHARDRFITESTESTSQFTFSDDGAGDSIYGDSQFMYDERFLYNQAVVTRDGGSPVTVDSTSSQATYGPQTRTLTGLLLRDDAQSRGIGEYIVYRYSEPQTRAEAWTLQPEQDATSFAAVFGLDIGHRVTVEQKPANKGTQFALALHIEQITETITPRSWEVSYRGSPADPNSAIYFTFGGTAAQSFGNGLWR